MKSLRTKTINNPLDSIVLENFILPVLYIMIDRSTTTKDTLRTRRSPGTGYLDTFRNVNLNIRFCEIEQKMLYNFKNYSIPNRLSSTIDGNTECVHFQYSCLNIISVNSNFLSDKTINKSDIFRLKCYLLVKLVQFYVFFISFFTLFHLTFYKLNNRVETDIVHIT